MRPLRFVSIALAFVAAALVTRPVHADEPGIHVEYYNGWMRVTLEGSYVGASYQVWRADEPAGTFQPQMADYVLCTGDCSILVQDAMAGRTYSYRFDVISGQTFRSYGPYLVTVPNTPLGLALFPNPVRGEARIDLSLPGDRRSDAPLETTVELFDARGRAVRTLHAGPAERGVTPIAWDGKGEHGRTLVSGVYFLRLRSALGTTVSRAVLIGR